MKKSLLIASLLAVALAACSKKEEAPAPVATPEAAAPAAAPAAPAADAAAPAAALARARLRRRPEGLHMEDPQRQGSSNRC